MFVKPVHIVPGMLVVVPPAPKPPNGNPGPIPPWLQRPLPDTPVIMGGGK